MKILKHVYSVYNNMINPFNPDYANSTPDYADYLLLATMLEQKTVNVNRLV